jgi:hypothetical protein
VFITPLRILSGDKQRSGFVEEIGDQRSEIRKAVEAEIREPEIRDQEGGRSRDQRTRDQRSGRRFRSLFSFATDLCFS